MLRPLSILPALTLVLTSGAHAQSVGIPFCSPTNNSTGAAASLVGFVGNGGGSNLHLEVTQGVPGEVGYFLVGNEATPGVATSNGVFCLIGTGTAYSVGYNASGGGSNSVGLFDSAGVLQNIVGTSTTGSGFDVPGTIPRSVPITIMSGDTWHFQVWYRDTPTARGSSNFSNGLSVTFPTVAQPNPIMGMVQLPPGMFDMGSDAASVAPYFGDSSTQPVHRVTISQSFWMSEMEITQAQYQAVIGTNPSSFSGPNLPVEQVTWYQARTYCAALTAQEQAAGNVPVGLEYRLPTEAEWEYACRAGTNTEFNVGTDLLCADAKFRYSHHTSSYCPSNSTVDVGSYAANAFGLYDMHGNVWEWCLDSYTNYPATAQTDPFVTTSSSYRILRGGDFLNTSIHCRSTFRLFVPAGGANSSVGFRIVLASVLVP